MLLGTFASALVENPSKIGLIRVVVAVALLWSFVPSEAEAQAIRLNIRAQGANTVRATCLLSAKAARSARSIELGRAYGGSSTYSIIARTTKRTKKFAVLNRGLRIGTYYYQCRFQNKRGRFGYSNRVRVTVSSRPSATPTPTPRPTVAPTQQPTQPPSQDRACSSTVINEVAHLVNVERNRNSRSSLSYNSQLALAAQGHTADMALKQKLDHGTQAEMVNRIRAAGFTGSPVGENIAWGQTSAQAVMTAWMNSTGHRNNILSSNFHYIGVGCVIDRYGKYWWTQNFGG